MARRLNVGLIFGGMSAEHEVSIISARSVLEAMNPDKYNVTPIMVSRRGEWTVGERAWRFLREPGCTGRHREERGAIREAPGEDEAGQGDGVDPAKRAASLADALRSISGLDVVFPLIHGPSGEDGTLQGVLEVTGIAYVGAGVAASAVGMDKVLMKSVFRAEGIPVLDYIPVTEYEWVRSGSSVAAEVEKRFGYPCFVKPANLGSSVGISLVRSSAMLAGAMELAYRYDRKALIERSAGDCREVECSVLGNDEPEASIPGEIVPSREFYDYEAKYLDGKSQLIIPARLDERTAERVRSLAIQSFRAVDCRGMARVDFFVSRSGPEPRVWVNEINTIPGFTAISMYPKLWEASGLAYPDLIDRLIELAFEARAEKTRRSSGAVEV